MKMKVAKILLFFLGVIFIIGLILVTYYHITTSQYNLNIEKLIANKREIIFYDINNKQIENNENFQQNVKFNELPKNLINAFISIEDKRFFKHNGVDTKGLLRAGLNNIKSLSFKEGGSTISQQLIKNTHLSSEKTINRKLIEIKLAKQLEKNYTKEEIMETYLNTIYFGKNCYGIYSASKNYFDKRPNELNLSECATLAGIVKAPSYYSPLNNIKECINRRNIVLKSMLNENYISNFDYENAINTPIAPKQNSSNSYGYFSLLNKEIDKQIEKNPYSNEKLYIYTYLDKEKQKIVEKNINNNEYKISSIILDKNNKILAYYSNTNEEKRQIGSTIKPLLVYAPAINENKVSESTLILDEKTDFGNYTPSNYNEKYYGYISVRNALNKSLNVPTVKILDYIGVNKAKSYINKTNIKLTDNDKTLGIALGSTEQGATLTELASSYNVFINNGNYNDPSCIKKIVNEKGIVIYKENVSKKKVFEQDTVEIINDILKESKSYGTCKKLNELNYDICSKTGTVGTKKGNTDAYNVSYTTDYVIGVWYGNKTNLMPNSISGGTLPTETIKKICQNIYTNSTPKSFTTNNCEKISLDKIDYDNNYTLTLADENAPKKYIKEGLFRKQAIPKNKSTKFTTPKIEIKDYIVNNNVLELSLCLTQGIEYKVYSIKNGIENIIFDSKLKQNKEMVKIDLSANNIYSMNITPYFYKDEQIFLGKPIYLDTIKTPANNAGADWWDNNFD